MTTAATGGSNKHRHTDLLACIPQMRAFARILTHDRDRADDLVHAAITHALTVEREFNSGINLKVRMFTFLHDLHYGEIHGTCVGTLSLDDTASQEQDALAGQEINLDLGDFRRAFWQLGDRHRELLILAGPGGLSREEIARVCGCPADKIEITVSRAHRELMVVLHRELPDGEQRETRVLAGDNANKFPKSSALSG